MTIVVRIIAHTQFFGVPRDLLPDLGGLDAVLAKDQDRGTDLARLTECAGRTCYDSYGAGRPSADYHQHILEVGHGSVLEHASISFYLDGISRGCSHELVRHRAGTAISQRSTRYVDESESSWAFHPLIGKYAEAHGLSPDVIPMYAAELQASAQTAYNKMVQDMQLWLVSKGIDKATARKQARGAARGLLGNALITSMVWTANLRALRNVIEQRASPHADAEIRLLANRLYECAKLVAPEFFSDYEKVECPDGVGYGLTTKYRKV